MTKSDSAPDYKDSTLPVDGRVADLLGRMTLEEKVAQLRSLREPRAADDPLHDEAQFAKLLEHGLGMFNPAFDHPMAQTVALRNRVQRHLTTKTRLGIPVLFLDEAHHGVMARGVDVFPHGLGIASSWDLGLVERIYTLVGAQARTRGTHLVLAPLIDVVRDPRWGRTGETLGEDPYLTGMLGSAMVRGFQGGHDRKVAPTHVATTLKVLTGHGEPEGGLNQGPANVPQRVLREMHMEAFRICLERTKPAAVMPSYDDIDGVPCHVNSWLLRDVLRGEWGFDGVVVSDWFAIDQLWDKHRVAPNARGAARQAFEAGVTVDLPHGGSYAHLVDLVKAGEISQRALDEAVGTVLRLKFEMGLFEGAAAGAAIDADRMQRAFGTARARALALEAGAASMVLLKNDGGLLPIRTERYKKIAVIGPMATVNYLGDYSGVPLHNVSLFEGLKAKLAGRCEVVTAPGVVLTTNADPVSRNNYQHSIRAEFPPVESNRQLITEAARVAAKADLVIVAVGENEQFSREAGDPGRFGDMCTLDLQSQQAELVEAMVATGKPVVVYLMHGRPLAILWIAEHVPAIVDGWFAGQEAGAAFADLLVGDANPSGKLPISYPRSAGHVPAYYNHSSSARYFDYVTQPSSALFPFGYGLSYTTFAYGPPRLSRPTMPKDGAVTVAVDVTNAGSRAGAEVVQLYVRPRVASVTRPVKALKGFEKVHLEPGETRTVQFTIDASTLAFWTAAMSREVEPGVVDIMIGSSSADVQTVELIVEP
jgi:beta-glucosidase